MFQYDSFTSAFLGDNYVFPAFLAFHHLYSFCVAAFKVFTAVIKLTVFLFQSFSVIHR